MIIPNNQNESNSPAKILVDLGAVAEPEAIPAIVARLFQLYPAAVANKCLIELRQKRAEHARHIRGEIGGRE